MSHAEDEQIPGEQPGEDVAPRRPLMRFETEDGDVVDRTQVFREHVIRNWNLKREDLLRQGDALNLGLRQNSMSTVIYHTQRTIEVLEKLYGFEVPQSRHAAVKRLGSMSLNGGEVDSSAAPRSKSQPHLRTMTSESARELVEQLRGNASTGSDWHKNEVTSLLSRLGHNADGMVRDLGELGLGLYDPSGRAFLVIAVRRSLESPSLHEDSLRVGFDSACRQGSRYVVITDADRFEVYDRTRGLDHASMHVGGFRLTELEESDIPTLDILRPR